MLIKNGKQMVPPEGGWGYMVALGLTLLMVSAFVPYSAFGIIYSDFLKQFGDVSSATSIVATLFFVTSSFMGIVANPLLTKFSLRKVGLVGCILFNVGSFYTIFITTAWELYIIAGLFQGVGFGLMLPVALTTLNNYFIKRRAFMNNLAQTGFCAINILGPMAIEYCLEIYGFRGTLAIISALTMNLFVSMMIMQPVEWHLVEAIDQYTVCASDSLTMDFAFTEELTEEAKLKLTSAESNEVIVKDNHDVIKIESLVPLNQTEIESNGGTKQRSRGLWNEIIDSLELSLLKEARYLNLSCGLSFAFYSDFNFLALTSIFLFNLNYSAREVAVCLTVTAVADFISRSGLSITSSFIHIPSRYIVFAGTLGAFVCRKLFIMYGHNLAALYVILAAIGAFRSWIQTPIPICFTEQYDIERFPAAWGLYMVISGFISVLAGSICGWLSQVFGSDELVVYAMSIMSLVCVIPWTIEFIFYPPRIETSLMKR